MDKAQFPRDKTCAGWIIPQIIDSLELNVTEYAATRVWQPMMGFRIGLLGHKASTVRFKQPVSYGIRRCEFDTYLLHRGGARLRLGEPVQKVEPSGTGWIINGSLKTPLLIGAGGHFCPIARMLRKDQETCAPLVTAVEIELPITTKGIELPIDGEIPQLYFCDDLGGYGWCVRKKDYLNLGIGRVQHKDVPKQWDAFLETLQQESIISSELSKTTHGHAYYVYDGQPASFVDDGVMLIGDAAGLADPRSGEGIRPAVESAIFAANTIHAANRQYHRGHLQSYVEKLRRRYGEKRHKVRQHSEIRPAQWQTQLMGMLIGSPWFARHFILNRWFLHSRLPALVAE
jgi:flavin-dependent dehydrogenase